MGEDGGVARGRGAFSDISNAIACIEAAAAAAAAATAAFFALFMAAARASQLAYPPKAASAPNTAESINAAPLFKYTATPSARPDDPSGSPLSWLALRP